MFDSTVPLGVVPKEMVAWVIREERHGEPQQAMQLDRVELPSIGPTEVLVAVMAAGINHSGLWTSRGEPLPLSRLRTGYDFHITGSDAAGIVWHVGRAVRGWKPGDEVIVHGSLVCGRCTACNGLDPLACEELRMWGYDANWGSFAPFARVQAQQLLPKPHCLTWEEAGSCGVCLFTAYRMLVTRARIQVGENVLIWGAAGGMGHFAIQLCQVCGAKPIAVVSSDEKAKFCQELGCQWTINHSHFDLCATEGRREFRQEIRRLTGGQDPDIVFEHVGKETFPTSVYVCKRFGRVVTSGATTGYDVQFDVRYLWTQHKSIIGSHHANAHDAERANLLLMEGKIRPVIHQLFPFERIPEATTLLGRNEHMGKITALVQAETAGLGVKE